MRQSLMWGKTAKCGWALLLACCGLARAQVAPSAYRVLGQMDLRQNGLNLVQGLELYAPNAVALDARDGRVRLYIADTRNARVLGWPDLRSYQTGDPPALVLGQPDLKRTGSMGIGARGLSLPVSLAVDPASGNLYVADFGAHRVVRFPGPFSNPGRVEPDTVYGQPNFTSVDANAGGISSHSLNRPRAVAFDAAGNLWIADSGNHRVLRFSAAVLDSVTPPDADLVVGQKDFTSGSASGGAVTASRFDSPSGLAFDHQGSLYVADFNNARVLKFAAPVGLDAAASSVFGQSNFTSRGVPPQASESTLAGPAGLFVDAGGSLYVAVPADNRVLVFSAQGASSSPAVRVLGQADFRNTRPNAGVFPQASPNTLSTPTDVKVDDDGNVIVADSGNHRVVAFPRDSRSANQVWGQTDFRANGANQIKPGSINAAFAIAVDYSRQPFALYVSDANNHRVLIWKDATRFRDGDPADAVIGQPDLRTAHRNVDTESGANPSPTGLSEPRGIALDSAGNLYVADSGNHRVLRYPRPVSQAGRITPDAVFGQTDFTSASSAGVTASSLRRPAGVAIGPDGNLFVADSGNNRILEFPTNAGSGVAAIRVYGQPNFNSAVLSTSVSAQTLAGPQGVAVDAGFNLYVADTGANRVLIFPNTQAAPFAGMAAAFVIGQDRFDATAGTLLRTPSAVATDSGGQIYVSDTGHHRVLLFPSLLFLPVAGGAPRSAVGQRDLNGTQRNWNSPDGLATPEGLSDPVGLFVDRRDTVYIGDLGNNRVVHFLKSAVVVNAAHFQASVPVARGALVTLFSEGLAEETAEVSEAPWPRTLANREVVINNDIRAPLWTVSPDRANLQIPDAAPLGASRLAVRVADTGELVSGGNLLLAAVSPGFFTLSQDGRGQAVAVNQDGRINGPASPAARGSIITLYGTGQGQVSPAVLDGEAAPSGPLAQTVAVPTTDGRACLTRQPSLCVAMGNTFGDVQFSGLAPGYIGLWQLNVRIPDSIAAADAVQLRVIINGTPSNVVTVAVR